jgi:hypothetical protein
MIYTEPLPKNANIEHLAQLAGPFPMTGEATARLAQKHGFDADTLHFLELFPSDTIFQDRQDLEDRLAEVLFLIQEEQAEDENEN